MGRPCSCDRYTGPSQPWGKDNCHLCWLYHHNPRYRALWDGKPVPGISRPRTPLPCKHRGAVREHKVFDVCKGVHPSGKLQLDLYHCSKQKCCTLRKVDMIPCCPCEAYEPFAAVPQAGDVRHLLYHVYPRKGNGVWQWNIAKLKRRLSLFNGSRQVAIAYDSTTDSPDQVKEALAGCGCEFIVKENVKELRETNTFLELFSSVEQYQGPGDVTLWGHAKGATSENNPAWGGVHRWTESLYTTCLDYWPAVRDLLQAYPVVGPWKRIGYQFPEVPSSSWHYSGSWRWFRNRDFFQRDWRPIDQVWVGIEAHPSKVFQPDEAGVLCGEFQSNTLALYLDSYWRDYASGVLSDFQERHLSQRWTPLLVTCILLSHQKDKFVDEAIQSVLAQDTPDWQLIINDSGALYERLSQRYGSDPRILVIRSPEGTKCQGWQINEVARQGLVRGDLVCYLSDDDVYELCAFRTWLAAARQNPGQKAWYGRAIRSEVRDGIEISQDELFPGQPGGIGGISLDEKIDGIQVCHRRELLPLAPWPETRSVERHADGVFLTTLGKHATIHPLGETIARHRHTVQSCYTRPVVGVGT